MKNFSLRLSLLLIALIIFTASGAFAQTVSESEAKPTVVKAVAPKFPPIARAARALGKAIVKVTINQDGEVSATKLVSGHPLLAQASQVAAKRWLFSTVDKKEAERFVELEFTYTDAARKEDAGVFFMPPYKVEISDYPPEINY